MLLPALLLSTFAPQQALFEKPPNVVVLVVDDVGVDMIGAYKEAPVSAPCTPNIDRLADQGLLFRNAWTNPLCSPSRAQILTGRHAFRTGMGGNVGGFFIPGLGVDEVLLPEALAGYESAALGKWHLANPRDVGDGQGVFHPLNSGFGYFAGSLYNLGAGPTICQAPCFPPGCCLPNCPPPSAQNDYYGWVKTTDGVQDCTTTYATTDTVNEALQRSQRMPEPWFLYVAFNAAHTPANPPPAALCSPGCEASSCPGSPDDEQPKRIKAMIQAMDSEIGRLLRGLRRTHPQTLVFFIGDNGTASAASEGQPGQCFDPDRVKGTLYEGGVNVPLIVNGPGVRRGELDVLVASTDLFATITELAGRRVETEDSVSMVPYLRGSTAPRRETVYAEKFGPNGLPFAPDSHEQAIRNSDYKLIRRTSAAGIAEELYRLSSDPCETTDLLPNIVLGSAAHTAYVALAAELDAL